MIYLFNDLLKSIKPNALSIALFGFSSADETSDKMAENLHGNIDVPGNPIRYIYHINSE